MFKDTKAILNTKQGSKYFKLLNEIFFLIKIYMVF